MPNNSETVMPINSEGDSCEFATVNIKAANFGSTCTIPQCGELAPTTSQSGNCKRQLASIRGCLSVAFGRAYFTL
jgi:hypothetical protein